MKKLLVNLVSLIKMFSHYYKILTTHPFCLEVNYQKTPRILSFLIPLTGSERIILVYRDKSFLELHVSLIKCQEDKFSFSQRKTKSCNHWCLPSWRPRATTTPRRDPHPPAVGRLLRTTIIC